MQVHPGGHAHDGIVDREGVQSSASVLPPQSVQSRGSDDCSTGQRRCPRAQHTGMVDSLIRRSGTL